MSTRFKKGVGEPEVKGLKPEIWGVLPIISEIFMQHGRDCIITGGTEEGHTTVIHPLGYAVDLRTKHLSATEASSIRNEIESRLTKEYQVLLKTAPPHIHVEFDPRPRGGSV